MDFKSISDCPNTLIRADLMFGSIAEDGSLGEDSTYMYCLGTFKVFYGGYDGRHNCMEASVLNVWTGNLSLDLPAVDRMATCRPRGVTAATAGVLSGSSRG